MKRLLFVIACVLGLQNATNATVLTLGQLEAEINAEINSNGNQAITGSILNGVLIDMTQTLGVSIGGPIAMSTPGYGLYVGVSGSANLLEQFPYGANVFGTLAISTETTGAFTRQNGAIVSGNCLKWSASGVQDSGAVCGAISAITIGSTAATGTAKSILFTDGSKVQALSSWNDATNLTVGTRLPSLTSGSSNAAFGISALNANTSGYNNTAIGKSSLAANTTGIFNTALGVQSLLVNTSGGYNTSIGAYSMLSNTTGGENVAVGEHALQANTTGSNNVAIGVDAIGFTTTGSNNTAAGLDAMVYNTTGSNNTAFGYFALQGNTVGYNELGVGLGALQYDTSDYGNTAIGVNSLALQGYQQAAGSFNVGTSYTILTVGTTNFTLIGAASNTVGVTFTASGVGSGTGTANPNGAIYNTALGYTTGGGIIWGAYNTILGAQITGLAPGLTQAIVIGTGDGGIHEDYNNTVPSMWDDANPRTSTATAPTAAGSGGTCATGVIAGHMTGTITLTGACAATNTLTLTFSVAAPIGYGCNIVNRNHPANAVDEGSITSTTITVFTFSGTTSGGTDVLRYICSPY